MGRLYRGNINEVDQYSTEQLVEMANTMKLGGNNAFLGVNKTSPTGQLSPAGSHVQLNNQYNLSSFGSLTGFNNNTARNTNGSVPTVGNRSYRNQRLIQSDEFITGFVPESEYGHISGRLDPQIFATTSLSPVHYCPKQRSVLLLLIEKSFK